MKNILFYICLALIIFSLLHYANMHDRSEISSGQADITPLEVNLPLPTETPPQREYLGEYTIYAYCPCVKCCSKTNGITASGTKATQGRTVAANLPFGTKIYIDGIGERIVEDRGGGLKGNAIDLFVTDHNSALQFGVRKVDVYEVME